MKGKILLLTAPKKRRLPCRAMQGVVPGQKNSKLDTKEASYMAIRLGKLG